MGERVASLQIVSWKTGGLPLPRTAPKHPLWSNIFSWIQTGACAQEPLIAFIEFTCSTKCQKLLLSTTQISSPCSVHIVYEYAFKLRHKYSWATSHKAHSLTLLSLTLSKTLMPLCNLCVSVQFFVQDAKNLRSNQLTPPNSNNSTVWRY
jgi:hypothetical protein